MNAHGVVAAAIFPVPTNVPTYALAWTKGSDGTNEMIGFQPVEPDGLALFLLRQDRSYNIGAFTDENEDGVYNGGEPMDYVTNIYPAQITHKTNRNEPLPLFLSSTNGLPQGTTARMPRTNDDLGNALPIVLGKTADLNAPQFSALAGESGMWTPFEYLNKYGLGLYFLAPYDADKIPVIYVYGISGSPQDWRQAFASLDHEKYQPWFFQYPGGLQLERSANALAGALVMLQRQLGFEQVVVVAHCMGGLVARGAIQHAAAECGTNYVSEFITLATPWNGHEAAALGVEHLSFPVPAWRDMSPGSTYLERIMNQPLPTGTRYDLIFGFKSSGGMGLPDDNDGVVGVASQLLPQAQLEAASVFGYNLDHAEILSSVESLARVNRLLRQ